MAGISEKLMAAKSSGNVGKQFIYKKPGNGAHIIKMPVVDWEVKASEKQAKVRDLFSAATVFSPSGTISPE